MMVPVVFQPNMRTTSFTGAKTETGVPMQCGQTPTAVLLRRMFKHCTPEEYSAL